MPKQEAYTILSEFRRLVDDVVKAVSRITDVGHDIGMPLKHNRRAIPRRRPRVTTTSPLKVCEDELDKEPSALTMLMQA